MSVLVFPDNPVNGQVYPPDPIPGVNQYKWNSFSNSWELLDNSALLSLIDAKGDLIVGLADNIADRLPVGSDGDVLVADSAEALGMKWAPPSYNPASIETLTYETSILAPGETQEFFIEPADLLSLVSIGLPNTPDDSWIRVYTSSEGSSSDTRLVPGPPYPSSNSGFAVEVITTGADPVVNLSPCPTTYAPEGLLVRFTNLGLNTQSFEVEFKYYTFIPPTGGCDIPPFFCNTLVNPFCVTDFSSAWSNCYSIASFPTIDTSSGLNFSEAWSNCYNMVSFSEIDTSSGTDFSYAWSYCYYLSSFPALDFSSGLDFTYSWTYCQGLTSFPSVDLSSGTNFYGAWCSCTYLTSLPVLDLSNGTDFTSAWNNCSSLLSFPLIDVSSGVNFTSAWQNCFSLASFPLLDVSSGTNLNYAWLNCTSLTSFPALDVSSGTDFYGAWYGCSSLTSFPLLDVSSGTNFGAAWLGCSQLTSFPLLDVSSGTNFGFTWQNCSSLTSFPLLDVSSGTTFAYAWEGCSSLTSFPLLDFSSATDFQGAWYDCSSLTSFPAGVFDSCAAIYFDYAWQNCALDQTSVDNILVSLDTAGQSNGVVKLDGGTSASPGVSGSAAKASLQAKGWTVITN